MPGSPAPEGTSGALASASADAKADADLIAVRLLLGRLNVTVLLNAEVTRLETDP